MRGVNGQDGRPGDCAGSGVARVQATACAADAGTVRARPAGAGRRQVMVLWASQTGNAEDFAAAAARRLSAEGHRASLAPMALADPAALPDDADLLLVTSTFGDGDPPTRGRVLGRARVTRRTAAHRQALLRPGLR